MSLPGRTQPEATLTSTPRRLGLAPTVTGEALRTPEDDVLTVRDSPPPELPDLPVDPTRFPITERDTYLIAGKFAQGGIGRILRAHDPRLDRPVALKELLVHGRPIDEERFIREVLLTARLQHPGIVPVYAAGRWPSGEPFYAMKLVSGRSFDQVIAEAKTLAARLALLPHVLAIAETVAYAHSQGIIHRDLKPHNVLVGAFGETVVIDWGLAKELGAADTPAEDAPPLAPKTVPPAQGLTFVGAVVGTPGYMSPEQADGADVDTRTDVYALGAILYHVLSGRLPYDASNQMNLVYRTVYEDPIPLRSREPDAPDELVAIVDKAMARDLGRRYATAKEFAEDLRRFQTGQIVGAHRYTPWERVRRFARRNRAVLALAAVSVALIVAVTVYSFLEIQQERDDAEQARDDARDAERRTQVAYDEAQDRADNLSLQQARLLTDTDPSAALRLLHGVSPRADWRRTRTLAADLAERGLPTVLHGHRAAVSRAAFSPDSALLATTSDDCTLRIWDLAARTSRVLRGHTNHVWRASWSPDRRLLASSSRDRSVRVWATHSGETVAILGHEREVRNVAFAPDGRTIYTGDDDQTLRRWDLDTRTSEVLARCQVNNVQWTATHVTCIADTEGEIFVFDARTGERTTVRAPRELRLTYIGGTSPDGRYVAAGTQDGQVWLWDAARAEGRVLRWNDTTHPVEAPPRELRFASTSDRLLTPASRKYLQYYDLAADRGELFSPHDSATRRATFSPDGRAIASVGFDSNVALLDLDARTMRHLAAAALMIDPQYSPDGRWLAAVGNDPRVFLWSTDDLVAEQFVPPLASRPAHRSAANAGATIAHRDGFVDVIDLATLRKRHTLPLPTPQRVVALAGDERTVLGVEEDGELRLWDAPTGRELLHRAQGPGCGEPNATLAPGTSRVILHCEDERVVLVDPAADPPLRELMRARAGAAILFFPDRPEILVGTSDNDAEVLVFDRPDLPPRRIAVYPHRVYAMAAIPGSDRFYVASDDVAQQWRLSGERIGELPGHQLQVSQIAVSRDGRWVLTASRDNLIRLFDVETGTLQATLAPPDPIERLIALSPDGTRVASSMNGANVLVWDVSDDHGGVARRREFRRLQANKPLHVLLFEGEGQSLVGFDEDGRVIRWRDELPNDPANVRAWIEDRLSPAEPVEPITGCAPPE